MDRMRTKEKLYKSAQELFVEKGLSKTTVREIADNVGVNSGLMHYYFKSKNKLALDILQSLFNEIYKIADNHVDRNKEPHIFHGTMMRLHGYFLSTEENMSFYIDCLKKDIFEELALKNCLETIKKIDAFFGHNHEDSYLLLMQSITINALRTMILKRESGLIDYPTEKIEIMEYKLFLSIFPATSPEVVDASVDKCTLLAGKLFSENQHLCDIRNLSPPSYRNNEGD